MSEGTPVTLLEQLLESAAYHIEAAAGQGFEVAGFYLVSVFHRHTPGGDTIELATSGSCMPQRAFTDAIGGADQAIDAVTGAAVEFMARIGHHMRNRIVVKAPPEAGP